jgi:hypothetical protein
MTITINDIRLLASERLTDDADGGGFMTANAILDGVENNLFPDISEIDRAQGAVDYRKAYGAVLADNADVYYGAHVIIDVIPGDEAVSALLVPSTGVAELRSELIARLNSEALGDTDGGQAFRGTKAIQTIASTGERTVKLDGLTLPLIPTSNLGAAASGPIVADNDAVTTGRCLVAAGTASATSNGFDLNFYNYAISGSVSGTVTAIGVGEVAVEDAGDTSFPNYLIFDSGDIVPDTFQRDQDFPGDIAYHWAGHNITAADVTYTAGLAVHLPRNSYEFVFTVGMGVTQFVTLPYQSERGSERIEWTGEDGTEYSCQNYGGEVFTVESDFNINANINRSTRVMTMVFKKKPKIGTTVRIYYCRKGYAQSLPIASLDGGVFSVNALEVDTTSGWTLRSATFLTDEPGRYELQEDGNIYSGSSIVGSYDATTRRLLMIVPDGTTVTEWHAVEVNNAIPVTTITDAPLPPFMDPETVTVTGDKAAGGTFTSTADSTGAFSDAFVTGVYVASTGKLSLTFAAAVKLQTLAYEGDVLEYTPVSQAVAGVNPDLFPTNGEVVAFRQGNVLVVHNTQDMAPQTVANAQVVNTGRTRIAEARVFGNDGVEITTGFTYSRTAGTVTFSNVSGYSQPVTIRHRVEDMSVIIAATPDGLLSLSKPLTHTYAADTSYASTALVIDDLQGRSHPGFAQTTWTGVWSDTVNGTPPLADYNEVTNPIVVSNKGGITERWVCIFTNTNTFRVIGEQVGEIAVGTTSTTCAPNNPATGAPYFTINPAGWGSGWATGNVYRFNTDGGSAPFWTIRSIAPSDPFDGQDRIAVALRGSINA